MVSVRSDRLDGHGRPLCQLCESSCCSHAAAPRPLTVHELATGRESAADGAVWRAASSTGECLPADAERAAAYSHFQRLCSAPRCSSPRSFPSGWRTACKICAICPRGWNANDMPSIRKVQDWYAQSFEVRGNGRSSTRLIAAGSHHPPTAIAPPRSARQTVEARKSSSMAERGQDVEPDYEESSA